MPFSIVFKGEKMLTKQQAIEAVKECQQVVKAWENWKPNEDQKLPFDNMMVKPLGDEAVSALSECVERFYTNDIHEGAWSIALLADNVRNELRRWIQDRQAAGDGTQGPLAIHPGGSSELWTAYRALLEEATRPRKPAPPSAKVQRDQGATPRSIAMSFGWKKEGFEDTWDTERVLKELKVRPEDEEYDPDTWVHPREVMKHQAIAKQWEDRCKQIETELSIVRAPRRERKARSESVEELARMPGMTVRQIAVMKCMTEDAVKKELAYLGMYLDNSGLHEHQPRKKALEDERLKQYDPHDECGEDTEARILAMTLDGVKPRNIAKRLTQHLAETVTYQKVTQVLEVKDESASVG